MNIFFNLRSLSSPLILSYIIIFYLLAKNTSCDVDPNFLACTPTTCANNNQSISYPFYIEGKQEPFCGNPGFGISCGPKGFPILNLSNTIYIIHHIFYENQTLRVANAAFSASRQNTTNSKGCLPLPLTHNLTLPSTREFDIAPNQTDIRLFYGCGSLPWLEEHKVGCFNETSSVLALYKEDKNISFVSKNCKGEVVDTIVEDGIIGGNEEALTKGFLLTWKAGNCSVCHNTGGRCGFDFVMYTFRCFCTDSVHSAICDPDDDPVGTKGSSLKARLRIVVKKGLSLKAKLGIASVVVGAAGVAVLLMVLACCFRKNLFRRENPTHRIIEGFLKEHGPLPTARYSYSEVKKLTNSFRKQLGQGGFGSVYKGQLHDGRAVAVKILNKSGGNGEEFINEVASISRTSHVNIVRLLGFCLDSSKRALIYEFMPNGSLDRFIYEEKNPLQVAHQLDCKQLYDIAIGIARGLEYLHRGCNTRILHFDIKPHNILLDEDFCPKISDFGLAKLCPRKESAVSIFGVRGTAGYIAPEIFSRNFGAVSHKSDVYSYGMMVLEMVGMKTNIKAEVSRSSEIYFPQWIYNCIESDQELGLQNIRNESDDKMVRKMIIVGLWCIQTNPSTRPAISKVVEMLDSEVELLQIPPKPCLSSYSTSPVHLSCETL
ncbi:LEAF RUST 10 DISEASE-RESISTANCE LOCUS RECEPTOR-LIKE PROTEIN KINASE-like 2.5 isoform X1 [Glycine soja]|uniref:LEAF RUST 10 DISEASE-RESISTANCE LOCUS RECEPTOR-LIKE PROTEIN KINASE-like 2.5 isoform X1 n=1 Tax=Glycine soja TaxID=3848 RepID=UPI00103C0966|nr:LEAF RUST 10 DISEASE-RESISTANCE LOCUS RECEPTOR-LIKE PROTEIN KINASE-like 2.5 isoform X1 [Glycine soja]